MSARKPPTSFTQHKYLSATRSIAQYPRHGWPTALARTRIGKSHLWKPKGSTRSLRTKACPVHQAGTPTFSRREHDDHHVGYTRFRIDVLPEKFACNNVAPETLRAPWYCSMHPISPYVSVGRRGNLDYRMSPNPLPTLTPQSRSTTHDPLAQNTPRFSRRDYCAARTQWPALRRWRSGADDHPESL